jgi:hypothetical protein
MNLNLNSVHSFVTEFKTGKHWHSASFSPSLNSGPPQTTSSGRYLAGLCTMLHGDVYVWMGHNLEAESHIGLV